ncbi:hypothetical protein BIFDEN_00102 [Bifidobacterium dentium ATCC 27678]|nr:hypothetical protein BIFDEN_00102 [Bifidobacterium dentium ATCC 27678]
MGQPLWLCRWLYVEILICYRASQLRRVMSKRLPSGHGIRLLRRLPRIMRRKPSSR